MHLYRFLDFYGWPQRPQNDPTMTPKIVKTAKLFDFYRFHTIFGKFSKNFVAKNVQNNQ